MQSDIDSFDVQPSKMKPPDKYNLKSFLFGAWVCTPFACFFMMMPAVILITPFVEIVLDTVMFH